MVTDLGRHAEESVARVLGWMPVFVSGPACRADAIFHQDLWHNVPTRFVVDHVCCRVVVFVDRFFWKSRRNRDGQKVLLFHIKSLSALCIGDVKTIGLAKGSSNVVDCSGICLDEYRLTIRSCIGLGQLVEHLIDELFELDLGLPY